MPCHRSGSHKCEIKDRGLGPSRSTWMSFNTICRRAHAVLPARLAQRLGWKIGSRNKVLHLQRLAEAWAVFCQVFHVVPLVTRINAWFSNTKVLRLTEMSAIGLIAIGLDRVHQKDA